jgi:hypothetical protein
VPSAAGIVHGDYRLRQRAHGRPRPAGSRSSTGRWPRSRPADRRRAARALLLARCTGGDVLADAFTAPGFFTEDELLARYADRSFRDFSDFGFYVGLAAFKLTVILEGIPDRDLHVLRGQTVCRVSSGWTRSSLRSSIPASCQSRAVLMEFTFDAVCGIFSSPPSTARACPTCSMRHLPSSPSGRSTRATSAQLRRTRHGQYGGAGDVRRRRGDPIGVRLTAPDVASSGATNVPR